MAEPELDPDAPPSAAPLATPPAAPPAAEPPPATPPPEAEHPDAVEVAGKKFVPVAALIGERKQRQAFQEKAARVDELEQFAREAKPYVEFLKANPDLLKSKDSAPPAAGAAPPADAQAELLAKTLDLYTADGKPDLSRANTMRTLIAQTAEQIAQRTVAPYQERSAQEQSARNFQVALSVKDANGRSPSPQALAQIWRTIPAAQTADPNVASILALTALGLDSVHVKAPPSAPEHAPIVTEGIAGNHRRPSLSALEKTIAQNRGISEEKWAEHTKDFTRGRPQTLEDD